MFSNDEQLPDISRMETIDLCLMTHDLRRLPEDKQMLDKVLKEISDRNKG